MSKSQIIAQLHYATALDQAAKRADYDGRRAQARQLRHKARSIRDAAYRCM